MSKNKSLFILALTFLGSTGWLVGLFGVFKQVNDAQLLFNGFSVILLIATAIGVYIGLVGGRMICMNANVDPNSISKMLVTALLLDLATYLAMVWLLDFTRINTMIIASGVLLISAIPKGALLPLVMQAKKINPDNFYFRYDIFVVVIASVILALPIFGVLIPAIFDSILAPLYAAQVMAALAAILASANLPIAVPVCIGIMAALIGTSIKTVQPETVRVPQRALHIKASSEGLLYTTANNMVKGDILVHKDHAVDMHTNVNLMQNINDIDHAYFVSALQHEPTHALLMGLNTSPWAAVLLMNPNIQKITIVDPNPKYLELLLEIPSMAAVLQHKKVEVITEDLHHWLIQPDETRYNLAVFYVNGADERLRLNERIMGLIKSRLTEKGMVYYQATPFYERNQGWFKYTYARGKMSMASDAPINHANTLISDVIRQMQHPDGKPLAPKAFDLNYIIPAITTPPTTLLK